MTAGSIDELDSVFTGSVVSRRPGLATALYDVAASLEAAVPF
jgi:hypothetical protein